MEHLNFPNKDKYQNYLVVPKLFAYKKKNEYYTDHSYKQPYIKHITFNAICIKYLHTLYLF